VEIALNSDNIQEGSEFSFTVSRGNLNLQASDTSGSFGRLDLLIGGLTLSDLGFSDEPGSFNISDAESAKNIIDSGLIDNALEKVTSLRGQIGAFTNRIDHSSLVQSTYKLNIMSAESRIRDIDYAAEIMNYVKERIIQQSSTAMKSHTMNSEKMFFKTLFS
jgi:flagellin